MQSRIHSFLQERYPFRGVVLDQTKPNDVVEIVIWKSRAPANVDESFRKVSSLPRHNDNSRRSPGRMKSLRVSYFFERIDQAIEHSHSGKRREVRLKESGRELRGIDAVEPFPWEMFKGIGGQMRLRRSVEFLCRHARKACRVAQPLLILVEAAPFVFFAAAARTGFVAADPGNGAAHRRGVGDNVLSLFAKYVQHGLAGDAGQPLLERA